MKMASIIDAHKNAAFSRITFRIVHTGQHYDHSMSGSFFEEFEIPSPDINLQVGSGSQAHQTARIMMAYEELLSNAPTDMCMVVGDVNSTMACAITAKKQHIRVAHVEAGLRSKDMKMPEEVNRLVTDAISDIFFTTSVTATNNLLAEGHHSNTIFFVGNTMVDTLLKNLNRLKKPSLFDSLQLTPRAYFILTLHRPANVDNPSNLKSILSTISESIGDNPVIFPVHPRTKQKLALVQSTFPNIHLVDPLAYLEFNYLVQHALGVVTDSGGITEETTVLGIPCITLRDTTERPETCTVGTNLLVGNNPAALKNALTEVISHRWKKGEIPELWDGMAGKRIIQQLNSVTW